MIYDHSIKAHGKYYPAGTEMPEENQITGASAEDIMLETEDIMLETKIEKPKCSRKSSQEKTE